MMERIAHFLHSGTCPIWTGFLLRTGDVIGIRQASRGVQGTLSESDRLPSVCRGHYRNPTGFPLSAGDVIGIRQASRGVQGTLSESDKLPAECRGHYLYPRHI